MACIEYVPRRFNTKAQITIDRINAILVEYEAQGFDLTVRQIYYQFVSRDWIKNSLKEYKNLAATINDARMAGQIDWDRIVDRTRFLRTISSWDTPADIIQSCVNSYKENLWLDQPCVVEVWVEKDALAGVIERVCQKNRVPFLSCRGYTSQSEMWGAGQRLLTHYNNDKKIHIIHLGDHDPSGIDMTRDIQDRMDLFVAPDAVSVHRIALNMDQVKKYNPPPNPAKLTDSRCDKYIAKHGRQSWELDALSPLVIERLIQGNIDAVRNKKLWAAAKEKEMLNRNSLDQIHKNYAKITKWLSGK